MGPDDVLCTKPIWGLQFFRETSEKRKIRYELHWPYCQEFCCNTGCHTRVINYLATVRRNQEGRQRREYPRRKDTVRAEARGWRRRSVFETVR